MTRKELEAILDPFINQSLKVCEDAMELLKASPRDFDRVVLVGGTTLSPRIRQRVTEFFGREPVVGLDPEEAVALGAAISCMMPVARKMKKALATPTAAQGAEAILDVDEAVDEFPVSRSFHPAPAGADVMPRPVAGGARSAAKRGGGRRWIYAGAGAGVAVVVAGIAAAALHFRKVPPPAPPPAPTAMTAPAASPASSPPASSAPVNPAPAAVAPSTPDPGPPSVPPAPSGAAPP